MRVCKYCHKRIRGDNVALMTHVRHQCPVKAWQKAQAKDPISVPPASAPPPNQIAYADPVALVNSLDVSVIRNEIAALERRRRALQALLTVAEARDGVETDDTLPGESWREPVGQA